MRLPITLVLLTLGSHALAAQDRAPDPSLAAGRAAARAAIAAAQSIPRGGIDRLEAVDIGGIKQFINVRGADPKNPILLFIHGGPGSPMMPESWTYQRPWEDFFTVVQWDQRGAGKTFVANGSQVDSTMTADRIEADAVELIQLLARTYGKRKIFLMGHSWGSVIGLRVAQHHPELLYAYIGVGQVVDGKRNEVVGYQETLARAKALGNAEAVKELESIAPYPEPKGPTSLKKVFIERKWDVALGGMVAGKSTNDDGQFISVSPAYTDADIEGGGQGVMSSVKILLPYAANASFDAVTSFKCPIFMFGGAEDRTTPTTVAEAYFKRITAPQKKFFKIPRAAHYVVNENPGTVLMHLVLDVRPLAQSESGSTRAGK